MDYSTYKENQELVKTDKNIKRAITFVIVIVIVVGIIIFFYIQRFQMDILNIAERSPQLALEKMAGLVGKFKIINIGFISLISLYFLYLAYKVFRFDSFPPPGMKVIRDTKLVRGKSAKAKGFLLIFFVCTFIIFGFLINSYLDRILTMIK